MIISLRSVYGGDASFRLKVVLKNKRALIRASRVKPALSVVAPRSHKYQIGRGFLIVC